MKKMKSILIMVFMVCMLSAALAGAVVNTERIGNNAKIIVSLTKQEPDPVEPGQQMEITFKLDNEGSIANGVIFEFLPEYPFSLVPGETSQRNLGDLASSQDGERSVIVKYKLRVDSAASEGSHEISARYKTEGFESWVKVEGFSVSIRIPDPALTVEKFFTTPEITAPGEKTKLSIGLKNYATSLLRNIKVTLNLDSTTSGAMPFSPIGSTNEKIFTLLEPGGNLPVEFSLLVDPDAQSKVYKIPVKFQYSDILNKNYSKTLSVSVVVGSVPDIAVYIDSTKVYTPGDTGEVTVKIVNKGLNDIKFLNANLDKADGYKLLSPAGVYVGNIDSDDYETVDYKIGVDRKKAEKVTFPLTIEYKDATNQNYKKSVTLEMPLYTSYEAKRLGLVESSNGLIIIIILIAAVAGFFGYRSWKKRKK